MSSIAGHHPPDLPAPQQSLGRGDPQLFGGTGQQHLPSTGCSGRNRQASFTDLAVPNEREENSGPSNQTDSTTVILMFFLERETLFSLQRGYSCNSHQETKTLSIQPGSTSQWTLSSHPPHGGCPPAGEDEASGTAQDGGGEKTTPRQRDEEEDRSEVSSTTSSAARAKIPALKRSVADAESFLGSEEGRGLDNIILKKLEIFERTLTAQVERTERMQGRMGLAPAEQEG